MNKEQLSTQMRDALQKNINWTEDAKGNFLGFLLLENPDKVEIMAKTLSECKARLCAITAYPVKRIDKKKRLAIGYHFVVGGNMLTVNVPLYNPDNLDVSPVPSITPWFRNADWNEREFKEMFNIDIIGHPNPKRLFLDERLDAGIMGELVPFSTMANGATTQSLWEKIMDSKAAHKVDAEKAIVAAVRPQIIEPRFTPVGGAAGEHDLRLERKKSD